MGFSFSDIAGSITDGLFDVGMGLFNDYRSRKSAKKSYHRQLQFSNSAHQREVQDLIAAGLNPVLAAGGNGAAGISVSSSGNPNMHRTSSYGQTYNSARLLANQNELMKAQQNQANSIAESNKANAELTSAKAVAQKAQNVIETGKSDFFKGLPEQAKYDVVNAMLYPNSAVGQLRGLAGSIVDGVVETGKNISKAISPETDAAIDELLRDLRNDAGSQGGHNSAKKVERTREELNLLLKQRERELKEEERKYFNKHMKGKVL